MNNLKKIQELTAGDKFKKAIDVAGDMMADEDDWKRLALCCLDQGGLSVDDQLKVARLIGLS